MKNQSGFTLLEVIIAVTILAFLSIFTARMIQQGAQAKTKIQGQIDRSGQLYAALQLMSRDIELAFNYRDINVELYNAAQTERKNKKTNPDGDDNKDGDKKSDDAADKDEDKTTDGDKKENPALTPEEEEEFALKEVKIYTRFYGEADKLNFTALSNFRSKKDAPQSDQAEIGYYLETCSGRLKKDSSSTCLWRRTSPYVDEDVTIGGKDQVLIENVKSLKFRYLGPGHEEEWIETWNSEKGEESMKGKFPTAVEITLTILDKRTDPPKDIAMTVVSALRFPNNKVDTDSTAAEKPGAVQ